MKRATLAPSPLLLSLLVGLVACGGAARYPASESAMAPRATATESDTGDPGSAPRAPVSAGGGGAFAGGGAEALAAPPSAPIAAPGSADRGSAPKPLPVPGDTPVVREGALLPDPGAPGIRAGEWDDNANYREFQKYLASARSPFSIDVSRRVFLVVRDAQGRAVPQCDVTVTGANDGARHTRTGASGRALFFPASSQVTAAQATLVATAHCRGAVASAQFAVNGQDQAVDLRLPVQSTQNLNDQPIIDIAFVLDTTGSMSEEIASVKRTIAKVTRELPQLGMRVRIGLVEFKDRGDQFVTRGYPLTENLAAFSTNIAQVSAGGGGDTPEAVEEGMAHAVYQLNWSENAASRVAFLIGDAPPHAERLGNMSELLKETQRRGITFHTVAASGMDDTGQAFWRRVAQYTGGTNMFVLRGGAGPQSTGAGDPISSCGGTHKNYSSGNLDELILGKIQRERDYLRADPMAIPGLATDENARPCPKRTQLTPLVAAR